MEEAAAEARCCHNMGLFGDSWASNASKNAADIAGGAGSTLLGEGQGIQAALLPFLRGEMTATHAFSPTQLNEMLSYAGAGAGGAAGSLAGEAQLQAARTGNTAATSGIMDKIARAKSQGLAKANEGIGAMDVEQTERNKQAGAEGMASLYGVDTSQAMKAMGLQSEDIANQTKASDTGGWFKNLMGTLSAGASGAGSVLKGLNG